MNKALIVSTEHTLGCTPRLEGRRLDVRYILWGIVNYVETLEIYQNDFEVSDEQIRHAIMYCKEEICEEQNVPQACNYCSKKFEKDIKDWEEFLWQYYDIKIIIEENEVIYINQNNEVCYNIEHIQVLKEEFEGEDTWKQAEELYL